MKRHVFGQNQHTLPGSKNQNRCECAVVFDFFPPIVVRLRYPTLSQKMCRSWRSTANQKCRRSPTSEEREGPPSSHLLLAQPIEKPSDQYMVEAIAVGLHLFHDGSNRLNQIPLFRLGQNPQRSEHFNPLVARSTSGAKVVNQQLCSALLGESDRFKLSLLERARQRGGSSLLQAMLSGSILLAPLQRRLACRPC